jgi:hypothetical protein
LLRHLTTDLHALHSFLKRGTIFPFPSLKPVRRGSGNHAQGAIRKARIGKTGTNNGADKIALKRA